MNTLSYSEFFLIWTIICCGVEAAQQLYQGDICALDGSTCENLRNCSVLLDELNRGKKPPICGYDGKEVIVCCSPNLLDRFKDEPNSISVDACRWYKEETCPAKINSNKEESIPTDKSELEEHVPFLGIVGYGTRTKISWRCGGVLISRRYILSAAHCASDPHLGTANWVRLRNEDFSSKKNIYSIVSRFIHPDYKPPKKYNDIALFRLNRKVILNSLVRPTCLPQKYSEYESFVNLIGSGWVLPNKKAESATNILKVIPHGECAFAGTAEEIPDGTDFESMICVNGYKTGLPGNCVKSFGGGPFFVSNFDDCDSGTLLGILSIGKLCDKEDFIGIYTNVSHFRPWIEGIVWPENTTYVEIVWNA